MKAIIPIILLSVFFTTTVFAQEWTTQEALEAFGKPGDTVNPSARKVKNVTSTGKKKAKDVQAKTNSNSNTVVLSDYTTSGLSHTSPSYNTAQGNAQPRRMYGLPSDEYYVASSPSVTSNIYRGSSVTLGNSGGATSYTKMGNYVYGSDGTSCSQLGNYTNCSDGTSYTKMGNYTYGSDGTSYTKMGNYTYGSDGTSYTKMGNYTYGSDGTSCTTMGNYTYCNK